MKLKQRIYCIEGHHDWGDREVEPSVEPMLQLLQRMGLWDYARRDCATRDELEFWIAHEWNRRCKKRSILYFAAHGDPGLIWLSEEHVSIHGFPDGSLKCEGCLVHFGACKVLADEDIVRKFMNDTKAPCVTGYGAEVGWTTVDWAPALAIELMLFSSIKRETINFADGRSVKSLRKIVEKIKEDPLFVNCKFDLFTKWDK